MNHSHQHREVRRIEPYRLHATHEGVRWILRLLTIFLATLASTGCIKVPVTPSTVFAPKASVTPATFHHPNAQLESFFLDATDGTRINAWFLSQPEAEKTVLFFGGYGFYLVQSEDYLNAFIDAGVNALLWDYRGYGRSGGTPSVATLKADSVQMYEQLQSRYAIDPEDIVVHGHSLGSFAAVYVAKQRPVAGLVLESPITSAKAWTRTTVPWYLRLLVRFEIAEELLAEDNLKRIAGLDVPLLVLAGGQDTVAPSVMAEKLFNAAGSVKKRLQLIEAGHHPDLMDFPGYAQGYQWLLNEIGGGSS